jgi:hypothetical protein
MEYPNAKQLKTREQRRGGERYEIRRQKRRRIEMDDLSRTSEKQRSGC